MHLRTAADVCLQKLCNVQYFKDYGPYVKDYGPWYKLCVQAIFFEHLKISNFGEGLSSAKTGSWHTISQFWSLIQNVVR